MKAIASLLFALVAIAAIALLVSGDCEDCAGTGYDAPDGMVALAQSQAGSKRQAIQELVDSGLQFPSCPSCTSNNSITEAPPSLEGMHSYFENMSAAPIPSGTGEIQFMKFRPTKSGVDIVMQNRTLSIEQLNPEDPFTGQMKGALDRLCEGLGQMDEHKRFLDAGLKMNLVITDVDEQDYFIRQL